MNQKFIYVLLATVVLFLCFFWEVDSKRVIFYNNEVKVQEGNLFISVERPKSCPMGMKRDHKDRCRRVVNYLKKRTPQRKTSPKT